MKSMFVLAGALVAVSSVAFAANCPQSRTSNDNAAGLGGSTHGRMFAPSEETQATSANCFPESETSNDNAAGLGGSTHGRRWHEKY
jgi:opacity protein-like surface antigen